MLLLRNLNLAAGIPVPAIARAFALGLRFDLIVVCYCTLPLVFTLLFRDRMALRKLSIGWLGSAGAACIFLGIVELDFYREFHARLNSIVFQYLKEDPRTVIRMLWFGFPVLRYFLLCGVLWGIYIGALLLIARHFPVAPRKTRMPYRATARLVSFLFVLVMGITGARGTLRAGPPLRWGDAYFSSHMFANHLTLNGTFTLAKALGDVGDEKEHRKWLNAHPRDEALAATRAMLVTDRDELIETSKFALLRRHRPVTRLARNRIKNVVLIILESYSGEFVGALERDFGVSPEFDKLAREGLLFDHFFSNGTHTHQGMFASLASFPNLPG